MNRNAVIVAAIIALACLGVGFFSGAIFFHRAPANTANPSPEPGAPGSTSFTSGLKLSASRDATSMGATSNAASGTNAVPTGQSTVADLKAALRAARNRWDLGKIYQVLDSLGTNQFREAIGMCLKNNTTLGRYAAIYTLTARWGRIDPQGAIAFAQTLSNFNQRNQVIAGVLSGWAENDSVAATAWAKQLPVGRTRDQAFGAIASTLSVVNPQAAITLMNSLPAGQSRQTALYQLFSGWASQSPVAAAAAALQLSGRDRDQAAGSIAYAWANQD